MGNAGLRSGAYMVRGTMRGGGPFNPMSGEARILLLPCCGNILLLRSEAGRTMSGREPTFLLGRLQCS
jgi:hypothetical protein